ncbi:unknown [Clostridium sp. CAG:448]|nr:unknown [Clostridium sp. CAG:448]
MVGNHLRRGKQRGQIGLSDAELRCRFLGEKRVIYQDPQPIGGKHADECFADHPRAENADRCPVIAGHTGNISGICRPCRGRCVPPRRQIEALVGEQNLRQRVFGNRNGVGAPGGEHPHPCV